MNKRMEIDMTDLVDIMEGFVKKLPSLSEEDQIDLAARLKPIAKACGTIDSTVKDAIKTKLRHKEGSRLGTLFKASLKLINTRRLNQSKLRENEPEIFDEYNEECTDERISFELR